MFEILIVVAVVVIIALLGAYFAPKGWRTVTVNVLLGAVTLVTPVLDYLVVFDFDTFMSPKNAAVALLAVNVVNLVLRNMTKTPLGKDL